MPRVCHFTGKSTRSGNSYRLRGRKKYLGGVGTKITSCTKRKFKPNIFSRVPDFQGPRFPQIELPCFKTIQISDENQFKSKFAVP